VRYKRGIAGRKKFDIAITNAQPHLEFQAVAMQSNIFTLDHLDSSTPEKIQTISLQSLF